MKIILLKNIPKVGKKDDIVEVSDGYAQNALFTKKLAIPATPEAIKKMRERHQNENAMKEVRKTLLNRAVSETIGGKLTIQVPTNEKGALFSKIDRDIIAKELEKQAGILISPTCIITKDKQIKSTGTYKIDIEEGTYKGELTLTVVSR